MTEFTIKAINNGWLLIGPRDKTGATSLETLYLPTISAVADILETWYVQGFIKAIGRTKEKYGGKEWQ